MAATQDCRIIFHAPEPPAQQQQAEEQPHHHQQQQHAGRHKSKKARAEHGAAQQQQGGGGVGALVAVKQLVGNSDEVTDLRFITAPPPAAAAGAAGEELPTHLAVSTNSEVVRVFDARTMSCAATLAGHTAVVLSLDALRLPSGVTLLASGAKDTTVRLWAALEGRCIGETKGAGWRAGERKCASVVSLVAGVAVCCTDPAAPRPCAPCRRRLGPRVSRLCCGVCAQGRRLFGVRRRRQAAQGAAVSVCDLRLARLGLPGVRLLPRLRLAMHHLSFPVAPPRARCGTCAPCSWTQTSRRSSRCGAGGCVCVKEDCASWGLCVCAGGGAGQRGVVCVCRRGGGGQRGGCAAGSSACKPAARLLLAPSTIDTLARAACAGHSGGRGARQGHQHDCCGAQRLWCAAASAHPLPSPARQLHAPAPLCAPP